MKRCARFKKPRRSGRIRLLRRGSVCCYNISMIRPTTPADTDALVRLTEATGLFKPLEVVALREVLDDFHAFNHAEDHHAITCEADGTYGQDGAIVGFAYYAPAPMTEGTWQLYWIAVRKDRQGQGIGGELLRHVEADIARQRGRVLFVETGSMPHYEMTRQFYRKNGYEQHSLLKDFYAEGDSMVVFRKAMPKPET
jgi:ribosomal protein S18 acetylase RimI-like enzyme